MLCLANAHHGHTFERVVWPRESRKRRWLATSAKRRPCPPRLHT
jgi:hypothetical protein